MAVDPPLSCPGTRPGSRATRSAAAGDLPRAAADSIPTPASILTVNFAADHYTGCRLSSLSPACFFQTQTHPARPENGRLWSWKQVSQNATNCLAQSDTDTDTSCTLLSFSFSLALAGPSECVRHAYSVPRIGRALHLKQLLPGCFHTPKLLPVFLFLQAHYLIFGPLRPAQRTVHPGALIRRG